MFDINKLAKLKEDLEVEKQSMTKKHDEFTKTHDDLTNMYNILGELIKCKMQNGEDVTVYLDKQDVILKELGENNKAMQDYLEESDRRVASLIATAFN